MNTDLIEDIYDATPVQQGIIFHSLYAPDWDPFQTQLTLKLQGPLRPQALERAWRETVSCHPILRTGFAWEGVDAPVQIVYRDIWPDWDFQDWRALSAAEQRARLAAYSLGDRQRHFDLSQPPLFRLGLVRIFEDTHYLIWGFHHALLDGWSMSLVLQEVLTRFETVIRGAPMLDPSPRQFREYIEWLRRQDNSSARDFWTAKLKGFMAPSSFRLPRPLARHAIVDAHPELQVRLSTSLTAELRSWAGRERITLNTLVQAAWALLLTSYSGEEDVVFGVTMSGRPAGLSDSHSMIGLFVNTLPLRIAVDAGQKLGDWLRAVQLEQATVSEYDYSSLLEVQKCSEIRAPEPLFESIVVFENYPIQTARPAGATLQITDVRSFHRTNYPLTLVAIPGPELSLGLTFDATRFSDAAAGRLLDHMAKLLPIVASDPDVPLGRLPLPWHAEGDVVPGAVDAAEGPSRAPLIHRRFEEQARLHPESVAICHGAERRSYGQLERESNRLARHLMRLGIGLENRVGIWMERSPGSIVTMLAILKCGAAYVPLDPVSPAERVSFMIADSGISAVVTTAEMASGLSNHSVPVIVLSSLPPAETGDEESAPEIPVNPPNAAYVIYTSGTTGQPKGVVVTHYNVARLFDVTELVFAFGPEDVWTQYHSAAFDFSVWEIWGALLFGGRLVIVPYWTARSPESFHDLLAVERVTVLNQTPSAFQQLVQVDLTRPADRLQLRLVVFGGEVLELAGLKPWFARHGDRTPQLVNMYGITETTVHVTWCPITNEDIGKGSRIGVPLPDLQVRLLDSWQRPVPLEVPGEIHVGGPGVARGYLNRPSLTADRFIADPFGEPGSRLYRSGDLARRTPDGGLEYLGRTDRQVKIRGFRIEPGEVEGALVQHLAIREAVVLARPDETGSNRLICYFVPHSGETVTPTGLRAHLSERMPGYMIPSVFLAMPAFPLTANGKLDQAALPAPDGQTERGPRDSAMPRTDVERALCGVWSEVLGAPVGIDDNFFDLGGDSIVSIRLIALARERGLDFSIEQLFRHQTVEQLAPRLGTASRQTATVVENPFDLIPEQDRSLLPPDAEDAYPLTRLQTGMLFHSEYSTEFATYHDIFSNHLRAPYDTAAIEATLQELVHTHAVLRTSFDVVNFREPLQIVHRSVRAFVGMSDISGLSDELQELSVAQWTEEEKRRHFDLTRAPLVRFHFHRRSGNTFQLSISFHHSLLDGWSVATLLSDFFRYYLALAAGRMPDPLLPPASGFRDYVLAEREALVRTDIQSFWQEKLKDIPYCRLPRYKEVPDVAPDRPIRVRTKRVRFASATADAVRRLAARLKVPLKTVLLAAHVKAISVITSQATAVTGCVSNARLDVTDGDRVLGLFLNTLPIVVPANRHTWKELIRAVYDVEQELLPFRRYPVAEIQRHRGGRQLFETVFNFVHYHVFDGLKESGAVEVLGGASFEETNFTFCANFVVNFASQLEVTLAYDKHELGEDQILLAAETYGTFLESLAADDSGEATIPSGISALERELVVSRWNDTTVDYDLEDCLHTLIERQATRTPSAPAVVYQGRVLTYRDLDAQANRLANYLQSLGAGPEILVAVCMDRCVELPLALVAVLKSGAAYMPIEPGAPAARMTTMMEDAKPRYLLTTRVHREALRDAPCTIICLDDAAEMERFSDTAPKACASPSNLAYVIHTSGSTGNPKGAMNTHRAVCNRLLWMQDTYRLLPTDRVFQKTPFSFDVSVWEFFWPLMTGARMVLAEPGGHRDPSYLVRTIAEEEITVVHFVPSMLDYFLAEPDVSRCRSLRHIFSSGEALAPATAGDALKGLHTSLHNLYGPTEAAVDVTSWTCTLEDSGVVPIGRPMANVRMYVVDDSGEPSPVGVGGALFIGGIAVGRGYWNQPDLTADRFVPDPFGPESGGRLYNTGDIARWVPGGFLEFLGRSDQQVKLGGNRIELGEIQAALDTHPEVRKSLVVIREDGDRPKRLVAYVVPRHWRRTYVLETEGYLLPNGLRVFERNREETNVLYREIFEHEGYLRHGITLDEGCTVFDVGANIGLFTLFVNERCPTARIYAFEPISEVFQTFEDNTAGCSADVRPFCHALGGAEEQADFTYYPHYSMMSGVHKAGGGAEPRRILHQILENQLQRGSADARDLLAAEDELLPFRLQSKSERCRVRRISDVICEEGVTAVDLLKIDVEGAELEVLRGIDTCDWEKIRQISMELHDVHERENDSGRLQVVLELLQQHGYEVAFEQNEDFRGTGMFDVYAVRESSSGFATKQTGRAAVAAGLATPARLREYLETRVPDYMIPASIIILQDFPLNPNGKTDVKALPAPGELRVSGQKGFLAPRNATEERLAALWSELLGITPVGVHDNFFELGGQSLIALQLVSRIRSVFQTQVSIRDLFKAPTIAGVALAIANAAAAQQKDVDVERVLAELEALPEENAGAVLEQAASGPAL